MSSTCKVTKNHMKELGVYPKTVCRGCGSLLWLRVYLFFAESDFFANLADSLGGDVKERSDIRASWLR